MILQILLGLHYTHSARAFTTYATSVLDRVECFELRWHLNKNLSHYRLGERAFAHGTPDNPWNEACKTNSPLTSDSLQYMHPQLIEMTQGL